MTESRFQFRAWDKRKNRMYPVTSLGVGSLESEFYEETMPQNTDKTFRDNNVDGKYVFMQWTGLCDKNVKKIFEGDIIESVCNKIFIKTGKPTGEISKTKYVIEYQSEYSRFQLKRLSDNCFESLPHTQSIFTSFYSVIGNKFEHPHLLEDK